MGRLLQIVPAEGARLFGMIVQKEISLSRANKGTFYRSGPKKRDQARWSHKSYKGWIRLRTGEGNVVTAEILSRSAGSDEWQLLHAFIGFLDRHFGTSIQAINIQYQR